MSREFKFRIWDKKHGRWFHGSTDPKSIALQTDAINLFGEVIVFGEILHDQHEDNVWRDDPDVNSSLEAMQYLEVCQYTGLKDRNGKEIYEGDIVKARWRRAKHAKLDVRGEVKFGEGWFYVYDDPDGRDRLGVPIHNCYNIEVIGNIHENPELLEEAS